ncbi:MAG: hypothetical protein AAF141_08865 [Pseudomonadota bacterium]
MAKSDEPKGKSEREKRLAAELRANLRRRKMQGRAKEAQLPSARSDKASDEVSKS